MAREMADGETIVRMGGYQGARSVHTRAGCILGREFLERAGDGYRFDFREDVTVLGRPSIDLFDMVEGDELDLCYFASSYLAHACPISRSSTCPSGSRSREEIYPKLDGALGSRLAEADRSRHRLRVARLLGQRVAPLLQPACGRSGGPRIAEACRSGR